VALCSASFMKEWPGTPLGPGPADRPIGYKG